MEPLEFGKFFVQMLQTFSARLSPLKECRKGDGLVKKLLVIQLNGGISLAYIGNGPSLIHLIKLI